MRKITTKDSYSVVIITYKNGYCVYKNNKCQRSFECVRSACVCVCVPTMATARGDGGEPTLPAFVEHAREMLELEHATERAEATALLEGIGHRERERLGVSLCRLQVNNRIVSHELAWLAQVIMMSSRMLPAFTCVLLFQNVETVNQKMDVATHFL